MPDLRLSSAADVRPMVARLAWPAIGEQVLQTLVGVVHVAIVGRLGAAPVAAVGSANQLMQVAIAAMGAFGIGTTVVVAREIGARRDRAAAHVVAQSLLAGGLVGLVLLLAGVAFAEPSIQLMGPEPEVVRLGDEYVRLSSYAFPALVAMLVAAGGLRGLGDTRTPLVAGAAVNVVNLALAYVLVFGHFGMPSMGVAGAALAAAIARAGGAVFLLALLFRPGRFLVSARDWLPDFTAIRRVLRIGIPTAAEQTLQTGAFLLYGTMLLALGTATYATFRITFQVMNVAFTPALGYGAAATTLVGQCLGGQRLDLARAAIREAQRQCLLVMVATGVFCAVFAAPLTSLFTADADVIALGAVAMPVLTLAQPFWGIGQVYAGSLRGAGDTRLPMVATTLGMWVARLPGSYLFGIVLGWGLPGVFLSSTLDAGVRALLTYLRHRSGRWQHIVV